MLALVALVVVGIVAFVIAHRAWAPGMNSAQAARALEQRLSNEQSVRALGLGHTITDPYRCAADYGAPVPGEPAWTYECVDATNPQESGFFVLTRGHKIAEIQPSG